MRGAKSSGGSIDEIGFSSKRRWPSAVADPKRSSTSQPRISFLNDPRAIAIFAIRMIPLDQIARELLFLSQIGQAVRQTIGP